MSSRNEFAELMDRLAAGEEEAACLIVEQYEREIRRMVRMYLTDPRLYRQLDSADVVQSVMANFLIHAANGGIQLESQDHLRKLLRAMARNRLRDHARKHTALRRDMRRTQLDGDDALGLVAEMGESPSGIVARQELTDKVRQRLTPEELELSELRGQGLEWAEIAERVGGTPESNRKRLSRGTQRVAAELHLDDVIDG